MGRRLLGVFVVVALACGPSAGGAPDSDPGDIDNDGDGYTVGDGDCRDDDPSIHPGLTEICDDGIDNNCNGEVDTDYECLSPCEQAAVDRSSVGCIYYAVDTNPFHQTIPGDYAVVVSNVDPIALANVVVEVNDGAGWATVGGGTFTVPPLALETLVLPHRFIAGSAVYAGGAYRITSDLPVIAYQFNPLDGSSSALSDASLLLPVSAYDSFYIVPAWPFGPADNSPSSGHPAHIQIVAHEPTSVRVTSPIATVAGAGVPALLPNVLGSFDLQEGDYLQLTVQSFMDSFAGAYIESDRPVALFSSNDCANVPAVGAAACCCEHLEEQVFGLQTWGTNYVGAQVPVRIAEGAIWQIMAQDDGTNVGFAPAPGVTGLPPSLTLSAREMVQYEVRGGAGVPGDFIISSDKPIHITQYMVGARYADSDGGNLGDPSMVQAIPVEQYLTQYVVLVPGTWVNDYLVLVRQAGATVFLDGGPVMTGWTAVGAYEIARVPVADGVHVLDGSNPFGVTVVGYDQYDSYAYPGGLNQTVINPVE